jgi:hypothetical protein
MKQNQKINKPIENADPKPAISRVTRRQVLLWMGGAGAAVVAGGGAVALLRKSGSAPPSRAAKRFGLPAHPSHNPAYRAWGTPDDGVVVWTYKDGKRFVGYRFNSAGRFVWRLCDGSGPVTEVAQAYAAQTKRAPQEATEFVENLLKAGVLAAGGYVVPAGSFPKPAPGGSYHPRISASDPKMS